MKLSWQGLKRAWLYQLLMLFVCFSIWFYIRTAAYLSGPPDGDLYAQTWSFQLMVGGLYLVGALPLLAVLFLVEAGMFWAVLRIAQPQPTVQPDGPASGGSAG